MLKQKATILFLFLHLILLCHGQGLRFNGNEKTIEHRTSYNVFETKHPTFKDYFGLKFDLSTHNFKSFGYIFRLTDKASHQTYNFTFTYGENHTSTLKFNLEGKDNLFSIDVDNDVFRQQKWLTINFRFHLRDNKLEIQIGETTYKVTSPNLPRQITPELIFGKCDHVIEVHEFSLRNLEIGNKISHYTFLFKESTSTEVHDIGGLSIGSVSNPIWLINSSYHWKEIYNYESDTQSGSNFDSRGQNALFFNSDSLIIFDLQSRIPSSVRYKNETPIDIRLGTNFIDTIKNKLYVYEVNNLPIDDITVASLDLNTYQWSAVSRDFLQMQLHHHAGYYNEKQNRYIVFGGFGNKKYNGDFLSLDIETEKWDTLQVSGDKIDPRYFTSIAKDITDNKLYLFGGMGNKSGDQGVGHSFYYDMYSLDLSRNDVQQLWNIPWKNENIVPVRNMIMMDSTSLYALCYPEHKSKSHLQLYRFMLKDGEYEILGDTIPIRSEKINTNANLFYSSRLNELYCVIQEFEEGDIASSTRVYALSTPPANLQDLRIYGENTSRNAVYWLLFIMLICILILLLYRFRNSFKDKFSSQHVEDNILSIFEIEREKDNTNSIYLFGNFTVYDRTGKDITYMYSTRLRLAFLLLICYTDGISSREFSNALWPDRADYNVKNLRGVTISQLRKILTEQDGITLVYDNDKSLFKLEFEDNCYCDFTKFTDMLDKLNQISENSELKSILLRGIFLTDIDEPTLNNFKETVNNKLKSIIPIDIERAYEECKYADAIQLSNILATTDNLSSIALYFKIHSLLKIKSESAAKRTFALYQAAFLDKTNTNFSHTYSSFIKLDLQDL